MILNLLFELIIGLLEIVFGWVSFPQMPAVVTTYVDLIVGYMQKGMGIVFLVIPKDLVVALLPLVIALENFDKLYSVVMWILKKIPFLGMK